MKFNYKLWLTILILGLVGVASLLCSTLPLDNLPKAVTDRFSPTEIKLLILFNPSLLVLIFSIIGTLTYQRAGLEVSLIDKWVRGISSQIILQNILKFAVVGGVLAGIIGVALNKILEPLMPPDIVNKTNDVHLSVISKVLYGGFTEEIMIRYGVMSLFVWILAKLFQRTSWVYILAIVLAAVLFGLGHLPAMYQFVPNPNLAMYIYVLLGNLIAGIIFGYCYWKQGLESAFLAHIMAHITMITLGWVL